MVALFVRAPRGAALSLVLLLAGVVSSAGLSAAEPRPQDLPINVDAASSEVDYRSNTVLFRDVVISQGTVRVAADTARSTGLDFKDSVWTFTGNVRLNVDDGSLVSDEARVQFLNNLLRVATITGNPAKFEQTLLKPPGKAYGRAGVIEYDMATGSVKFSKDAWLTDGRNEISGEQLVYNVQERRVLAETQPGDGDRVRITIRPEEKPPADPQP